MKIAMFTNTYLPHVGGVAKSVASFVDAFRDMGHEVLVVAPEYDDTAPEPGVVRVPAIRDFNKSGFNVAVPLLRSVDKDLDAFGPDIVHAHHPFLLGDTALRAAAARNLPLVFTHHTRYEQYAHYLPVEAAGLGKAVINLALGYARQCTYVIAPSESIRSLLLRRGMMAPCAVAPTGIDVARFASGDGAALRRELGVAPDTYMPGHVGRLAPEKNLGLLADGTAKFLRGRPEARFLVVGTGPDEPRMRETFAERGVADRVHFLGKRTGAGLYDAYAAMDVFLFTSTSETQGMVIAEAMAAGKPVVAIDADAIRDIVVDNENGKLLKEADPVRIAKALAWFGSLDEPQREQLRQGARDTAARYDIPVCAERTIDVYRQALSVFKLTQEPVQAEWAGLLRSLEAEWEIWSNRAASLAVLFGDDGR